MKKGEIMAVRAIFERVGAPLPFETAVKIAQFMRRTDEFMSEVLAVVVREDSEMDYEKAQKEISELYKAEVPEISLKLSQEELSGAELTVGDVYELLEAGVLEEAE